MKRLYCGSKACVWVGNEVSEWFPVRVGLRQVVCVAVAVQFVY